MESFLVGGKYEAAHPGPAMPGSPPVGCIAHAVHRATHQVKRIGRGSYGSVYLACRKAGAKGDGFVVLKRVFVVEEGTKEFKEAQNEVQVSPAFPAVGPTHSPPQSPSSNARRIRTRVLTRRRGCRRCSCCTASGTRTSSPSSTRSCTTRTSASSWPTAPQVRCTRAPLRPRAAAQAVRSHALLLSRGGRGAARVPRAAATAPPAPR
jgi:hypothetical protein